MIQAACDACFAKSLERTPPTGWVGRGRRLLSEVERLRAENEKLKATVAELQRENQQLKGEIRRLKH